MSAPEFGSKEKRELPSCVNCCFGEPKERHNWLIECGNEFMQRLFFYPVELEKAEVAHHDFCCPFYKDKEVYYGADSGDEEEDE